MKYVISPINKRNSAQPNMIYPIIFVLFTDDDTAGVGAGVGGDGGGVGGDGGDGGDGGGVGGDGGVGPAEH